MNARLPSGVTMAQVPKNQWPVMPGHHLVPIEVWCSRFYLAQVFDVSGHPGIVRMTVCRTDRHEGISWDELQQIKKEIGRGDQWAVEVFPSELHVVDVAHMRHLWFVPTSTIPFAWGAT